MNLPVEYFKRINLYKRAELNLKQGMLSKLKIYLLHRVKKLICFSLFNNYKQQFCALFDTPQCFRASIFVGLPCVVLF